MKGKPIRLLMSYQKVKFPRLPSLEFISSHDLHIEKGRHRKTILSERKCFLCGMAVEDEKHFVMECD